MINMNTASKMETTNCSEEMWEDCSPSALSPKTEGSKPDLHFIEDLEESPPPNLKRKPSQRYRKTSSPEENSTLVMKNDFEESSYSPQRVSHHSVPEMARVHNEKPKPTTQPLGFPPSVVNNSKLELPKPILIPGKETSSFTSVNELTDRLKSSLIFGDTKDLLVKVQNEGNCKSLEPSQNYHYNLVETNKSDHMSDLKSGSDSVYSESSETDIMLHNFIRHEPPSTTVDSNIGPTTRSGYSGNMVPINHSEFMKSPHPLVNGTAVLNSQPDFVNANEHDSNSSMSDSPLQNVSPYGSYEKQMSFNIGGSLPLLSPMAPAVAQHSFPFPAGLESGFDSANNFQSGLPNHNVTPQMAYPSLPLGYIPPTRMVPVDPRLPRLPQYPYPNFTVPQVQGQNLSNPAFYQSSMHHLALYQHQQNQLAALNATGNLEPHPQEQANPVNQSELHQGQHQSHLLSTLSHPITIPHQNMPQMIPKQNSPQLITTGEMSSPKPDAFLNEHQQQKFCQNVEELGFMKNNKTEEEKMLQYFYVVQTLHQLQKEFSEDIQTQVQLPPIHIPPSQPFNMYNPNTVTAGAGINNCFPGMPIMPPVQQHLNQQMLNPNQMFPNINAQQDYPNISGLQNTGAELNSGQAQVEIAPGKVGRGRGRLH